jgi:acyl carrier protein
MATEILEKVKELIVRIINYRPKHGSRGHKRRCLTGEDIMPKAKLIEDLGFDDLKLMRLRLELEKSSGKDISDEEMERVITVQDVINLLYSIIVFGGERNLGPLRYFTVGSSRAPLKLNLPRKTRVPGHNLGLSNYLKHRGCPIPPPRLIKRGKVRSGRNIGLCQAFRPRGNR